MDTFDYLDPETDDMHTITYEWARYRDERGAVYLVDIVQPDWVWDSKDKRLKIEGLIIESLTYDHGTP
jgi:hypothetical protein